MVVYVAYDGVFLSFWPKFTKHTLATLPKINNQHTESNRHIYQLGLIPKCKVKRPTLKMKRRFLNSAL